MRPILFELGSVSLPAHAVLGALGFALAALWLWPRLLGWRGADPQGDGRRARRLALPLLIGMLAGARLLYVAVELARVAVDGRAAHPIGARFLDAPWTVLFFWEGGLVMYGGFAGACLAGALLVRRVGLARGRAFDCGLTAGFAGLALGRLGCLAAGDDYGRAASAWAADVGAPLVLRVPERAWFSEHPASALPRALAGQAIWNTQALMSAVALALCAYGLLRLARRAPAGRTALELAGMYAVARFGIESLRGDAARGLWFGDALSTSQLLSALLLAGVFGAGLVGRTRVVRTGGASL